MPESETPPEWKLVKTADGHVSLLWAQRDQSRSLDLGPFDEACEKLVEFMARHDFGEQ